MGYKNDDKCIRKAYPDEKLFVLMARDPAAAKVVIHWIAKSFDSQPTEKLREAFECAIEMRDRCDEFRDRKMIEEKEKIAAQERDEFERWKKQRDGTVMSPLNQGQPVIGHEEAMQKVASNFEVNFARNFANWLDAQGHDSKEEIISTTHGFAKFLEEFIKSVPGRR